MTISDAIKKGMIELKNDKERDYTKTVKKLSKQIIEGEKTYPDFDDSGNR